MWCGKEWQHHCLDMQIVFFFLFSHFPFSSRAHSHYATGTINTRTVLLLFFFILLYLFLREPLARTKRRMDTTGKKIKKDQEREGDTHFYCPISTYGASTNRAYIFGLFFTSRRREGGVICLEFFFLLVMTCLSFACLALSACFFLLFLFRPALLEMLTDPFRFFVKFCSVQPFSAFPTFQFTLDEINTHHHQKKKKWS